MSVGPFETMTVQDAQAYCVWFVSQQDMRVAQLAKAYRWEVGNDALDETRESLVPLWQWMSRHAEERRYAPGECEALNAHLPEWALKVGIQQGELSSNSLTLAVDGGFYLASVFQRVFPGQTEWVRWDRTKDHFYNRPVLAFGRYPLIPHEIFVNNMWAVVEGAFEEDQILKLYDVWCKKLR